jgi:hypothetical protein
VAEKVEGRGSRVVRREKADAEYFQVSGIKFQVSQFRHGVKAAVAPGVALADAAQGEE